MTSYLSPTMYPENPCVNRPIIRLDCSYLATTRGLLKFFELIFTVIAAGFFFFSSIAYHNIDQSHPHGVFLHKEIQVVMTLGYVFYRLAPYVLGCSVNILMWSYLFHVVERFQTIPWYTIEYIVSATCALLSLACAILATVLCVELNKFNYHWDAKFVIAAFFSFGAVILFIYDIIMVYLRKKMKIPPQE